MPDAVRVRVVNTFSQAVGSWINAFSIERISGQNKGASFGTKFRKRCKEELRHFPEPLLEAPQVISTTYPNLLHNLLVEVIEKLLPGITLLLINLGFKVVL